jgi:hypothetical protein
VSLGDLSADDLGGLILSETAPGGLSGAEARDGPGEMLVTAGRR